MRKTPPEKLEAGRFIDGDYGSPRGVMYGAFEVFGPCGAMLKIIASDGVGGGSYGWEHTSVSTPRRPPNWEEMAFVKRLFWEPEECVVQYHPPESTYVNNHPYVLHLWRHRIEKFPMPPSILVGVKSAGLIDKEQAKALREMIANGTEPG